MLRMIPRPLSTRVADYTLYMRKTTARIPVRDAFLHDTVVCEWSTHINTRQHFSVCCPVHVYSDPASGHVLVSPHPHARDHSSNALALAQGCAKKKARSHATCGQEPRRSRTESLRRPRRRDEGRQPPTPCRVGHPRCEAQGRQRRLRRLR